MKIPFHELRLIPALAVVLVGLQSAPVYSQEPTQDLAETVAAFNAAIVTKDRAALDTFIASDFFWITGTGDYSDKTGFIDALTASELDIRPYVSEDVRWNIAGDSALLAAVNRLEGTNDGEPFTDPHRYSNLWRLRDGRWQLVFIQITQLPDRTGSA